jgi:hypothetical protein
VKAVNSSRVRQRRARRMGSLDRQRPAANEQRPERLIPVPTVVRSPLTARRQVVAPVQETPIRPETTNVRAGTHDTEVTSSASLSTTSDLSTISDSEHVVSMSLLTRISLFLERSAEVWDDQG